MIAQLFPPSVTVVTAADLGLDDRAALGRLHPLEAESVRTAVPRRQGEFAAARACAHEALKRIGADGPPVLRGDRGMPVFPDGVVGTLAHCTGMRVAAVAPRSAARSLGVDVEPVGDLPRGVLPSVSLRREAEWVARMSHADPGVPWDRLLFTTKEAVYKAWFPVARRWLGFQDAELTITADPPAGPRVDPDAGPAAVPRTGTFRARILVDPTAADGGADLDRMSGRWVVDDALVASAVALPPAP